MKDEKSYGYRDEQLKNDLYRIAFTGNSRTSDQKIYDYFMRRSAEVALEHHYQYFTVIETEDLTKYITVAAEAPMTKARIEAFPYAGSVYSPTMYKTIPRHKLIGEIQLFKEGTQPKTAYSVEEILQKVKL